MKKLPERRYSSGIIQLLPLLVVAFVLVSFVAISAENGNVPLNNIRKAVLGESDSSVGGNDNVDSQTKTTSDSNSGTSSEDKSGSNNSTEVEKDSENETETKDQTETKDTTETEKETEVKDGTGAAKIKIKQTSNKFSFEQPGFKFQVESKFPLSVNPVTRELTVTTPAGTKTVAVLPQQAVDNMLAKGYISQVLGESAPTQSPSATTTGVPAVPSGVTLTTLSDGSVVYQIDGAKSKKFLGLFLIAIPKTLNVSAQDGTLVSVNQSFFSKVLDTISI